MPDSLIDLVRPFNQMYGDAPHLYTDKGSNHTYLPIYEKYMADRRDYARILELGVATGGSIHLWSKYFTDYNIDGMDICSTWFNARPFQSEIEQDGRIRLMFSMDSRDHRNTKNFEDELYDFVIDDGDHDRFSQIDTFRNFFSKTAVGGVYFIEDMENSDHVQTVLDGVVDYLDACGIHAEIYVHAPLVNGWDAMVCVKRLNKGEHIV